MHSPQGMIIYANKIATMVPSGDDYYGLIDDGAILVRDGLVEWVGSCSELDTDHGIKDEIDFSDKVITPALIDCHTHIVYGGNRAAEFEQRLNGMSYLEIAKAGGGILSTVYATRSASEDELYNDALCRLNALGSEGVGVVEVKSGYGLTQDDELKMLRVATRLAQETDMKIIRTFLGAHAIAPEYQDRPDDYIKKVCIPTLERGHELGLIDAVDAFCETIAFSTDQLKPLFDRAKQLGLPVKLHAEQLSDQKGSIFAANYSAQSVDHLEYLDPDDVQYLAKSDTVATLLPGAFYTLRETQLPPISALIDAGVDLAIATDSNPGSSPMTSLLLAMNMACTLFRMTPAMALTGVTRNAAKALGLNDHGWIGKKSIANFAVWDIAHPNELSYRIGFNPLCARIIGGKSCQA